MADQVIHIG